MDQFSRRWMLVEGLESRALLSAVLTTPLTDVAVSPNASPGRVNLASFFSNTGTGGGTVVRLETSQGPIDIKLRDSQTPLTAANFLSYVNKGRYDESIFHRSVTGFVIQGGGYGIGAPTGGNLANHIPEDAPVPNEFSRDVPDSSGKVNTRGTVALAKIGGNPDSGTSEFFVNLNDNSSNLDTQNGGFTVFGDVINGTMSTVDQIAALPIFTVTDTVFSNLPLVNYPGLPQQIQPSNLVVVNTASVVNGLTYTASSDNSALVTPTVDNGALFLAYGAG